MIVGEVQYRNALPWGLVLVHVTLAATIWAFSARPRVHVLWRPPAPADPASRLGPMARELRIHERPTSLERPVLIAAFRGWNDGGQAATLAGGLPRAALGRDEVRRHRSRGLRRLPGDPSDRLARRGADAADRVARERLLPRARSRAPIATRSCSSASSRTTAGGRSASSSSTSRATSASSSSVTLGALLADVPHTRPAPVTGAATDPQLVEELGLQLSRYEGPTGIVGVLHDACRRAGIPSVSLWSAVPHYVSLAPSPRGREGALRAARRAARRPTIDLTELDEAPRSYAEQVIEAVASDAETAGVRRGARAAGRLDRAARGVGRPPLRRLARCRADAVPARARGTTATPPGVRRRRG